jgi:hypothetical protein
LSARNVYGVRFSGVDSARPIYALAQIGDLIEFGRLTLRSR